MATEDGTKDKAVCDELGIATSSTLVVKYYLVNSLFGALDVLFGIIKRGLIAEGIL